MNEEKIIHEIITKKIFGWRFNFQVSADNGTCVLECWKAATLKALQSWAPHRWRSARSSSIWSVSLAFQLAQTVIGELPPAAFAMSAAALSTTWHIAALACVSSRDNLHWRRPCSMARELRSGTELDGGRALQQTGFLSSKKLYSQGAKWRACPCCLFWFRFRYSLWKPWCCGLATHRSQRLQVLKRASAHWFRRQRRPPTVRFCHVCGEIILAAATVVNEKGFKPMIRCCAVAHGSAARPKVDETRPMSCDLTGRQWRPCGVKLIRRLRASQELTFPIQVFSRSLFFSVVTNFAVAHGNECIRILDPPIQSASIRFRVWGAS